MPDNEVTVVDFIRLANDVVGFGLIPSGQKNYELASRLAKQEAIGFHKWYMKSDWIMAYDGDGFTNPKSLDISVSHDFLFKLYLESKAK